MIAFVGVCNSRCRPQVQHHRPASKYLCGAMTLPWDPTPKHPSLAIASEAVSNVAQELEGVAHRFAHSDILVQKVIRARSRASFCRYVLVICFTLLVSCHSTFRAGVAISLQLSSGVLELEAHTFENTHAPFLSVMDEYQTCAQYYDGTCMRHVLVYRG